MASSLDEGQFEFAGSNVAPTRMGNIAAVAPYYAASRYAMSLQVFWTRLQKVMQADAGFYAVVQESKRQLDFLVSLFWQTAVFTLIWTVALPFIGNDWMVLLTIALAGPLLMFIWYGIALTHYKNFSDLVRASIDLYRLALLKELKIPPPPMRSRSGSCGRL